MEDSRTQNRLDNFMKIGQKNIKRKREEFLVNLRKKQRQDKFKKAREEKFKKIIHYSIDGKEVENGDLYENYATCDGSKMQHLVNCILTTSTNPCLLIHLMRSGTELSQVNPNNDEELKESEIFLSKPMLDFYCKVFLESSDLKLIYETVKIMINTLELHSLTPEEIDYCQEIQLIQGMTGLINVNEAEGLEPYKQKDSTQLKYLIKVVEISLALLIKFIKQSEYAASKIDKDILYTLLKDIIDFREIFKMQSDAHILPELELIILTLPVSETDRKGYQSMKAICSCFVEEILDSKDAEYSTNLMTLLTIAFSSTGSLIDILKDEPEFYGYLIAPFHSKMFSLNDLFNNFLSTRLSLISAIIFFSEDDHHMFHLLTQNLLELILEILKISDELEISHCKFKNLDQNMIQASIDDLKAESLFVFSNLCMSNKENKENILEITYGQEIVQRIIDFMTHCHARIRKESYECLYGIVHQCEPKYITWLCDVDVMEKCLDQIENSKDFHVSEVACRVIFFILYSTEVDDPQSVNSKRPGLYTQKLHDMGGIDILQDYQMHPNEEFRHQVNAILSYFYNTEDDTIHVVEGDAPFIPSHKPIVEQEISLFN
ncbi:unnamed protein product [Moneuplotes crassus]|uniref:Uncharacterized protein n=1 Tax=Euplotes crassus TaxID=5936 RepID=A0AAD1YAG7_EUPCR|nr:unnamed protein product [Moneuplotes crassus]